MSDPHAPDPTHANPNVPGPEVIREFPDRGTQWLPEDPVQLRDLLQLLQPELAQRLDVSRAQRINRTMIPPDLQKKESYVIFRMPYRADVFYTGESGWNTPLNLAHLMELPPELRRFVPQRYCGVPDIQKLALRSMPLQGDLKPMASASDR